MERTLLLFAIGAVIVFADDATAAGPISRAHVSMRPAGYSARPDTSGGWMQPLDRHRRYVFVTTDTTVEVYTLDGHLHGQITDVDAPEGIAVDLEGNLYVVDDEGSDISVFHRSAVKPFKKLGDPSYEGFTRITVARDGTVYATVGIYSGYGGEIFAFPKGSLGSE